MDVTAVNQSALAAAVGTAKTAYAGFEGENLKLDLTRGKPSAAQLDLTEPMLTALQPGDHTASGVDVRNYGPPAQGLVELREIFAAPARHSCGSTRRPRQCEPFELGVDPDNANLRIAPTLPPLNEVEHAMRVLTTRVILAAGETRP